MRISLMRLIRCSGLWESKGRSSSGCGLVASSPIEIRSLCAPGAQSVRVRNQIMNGCVTGNCRAWMLEKMPRMVCFPEPGSM